MAHLFRHRKDLTFLAVLYLFYLGLSALFILPERFHLIHDNQNYTYPFFKFQVESLHKFHEPPFWIPQASRGLPSPLLYHPTFALFLTRFPFYVFALLSPSLPDTALLYKLNLLLNNIVCSFFFFLLLKELFQRRLVVYWGTIIALFSGMSTGTLCQEQLSASLLYVPLILFMTIRLHRTRRTIYGFLLGAFLGQALSNHQPHLIAYSLGVFLLAYLLAHPHRFPLLWRERAFWLKQMLGVVAPVALVLFSLSLFNFVEYGERLASLRRAGGIFSSYDLIQKFRDTNSLDPNTLKFYLSPRSMLNWGDSTQTMVDRTPYYLGIPALLFVALALLRPTREKVFWSLSVLGCFLFALGDRGFVYSLLYRFVPFASLQQIPVHMGNYMNIGLLVLSCLGFDDFLSFLERRRSHFSSWRILTPSVVTIALFIFLQVDLTLHFKLIAERLVPDRVPPPVYDALSTFFWFKDAIPPMPQRVAGNVSVLSESYSPNQVKALVKSSGWETLRYPTNWDRSWRAAVDNQPAPVVGTPQGISVTVPPGEHVVDFHYVPMVVMILFYGHLVVVVLSLAGGLRCVIAET